jgi:hypothetical protein
VAGRERKRGACQTRLGFVATYKQIGTSDLALAMEKFGTIAEDKLAPRLLGTFEIQRVLSRIEAEAAKRGTTQKEAFGLIRQHYVLQLLAAEIMQDRAPLLYAIQYAIVALCITVDPISVFQELRQWLRGSEGLRAIGCLIYLQSDGIADVLKEREVDFVEETEAHRDRLSTSMAIAALASKSDAPACVARLLEDVFVASNDVFPVVVARYLRESFFGHLRSWLTSSTGFPKGEKAAEDLFVCLLRSPVQGLKKQTLDMLTKDEMFLKPDSSLQRFAHTVIKRGVSEAKEGKSSG